ncbi:MAG: hypothetical protein CL840_18110 [Crocinitomicaceae bacterium]|nr:hypothetical protein [Crocinitomicaceae bacterium]|tara:strand:- start:19899 stop:21212 length:1314 start_codon:yes stop_codon:yes gene_type:complete
MKKLLIFILLLSVVSLAYSQSVILGSVVDAMSKAPIEGAHVFNQIENKNTVSNNKGHFIISTDLKRKLKIRVSHLGYSNYVDWVWLRPGDTLYLTIELKSTAYELKPFETYDIRKPQQMFHSPVHYVHDFDIEGNNLLLITFSRSLKKDPKLTLCDLDENIVDELTIDPEPIRLHRDFADRVFIEYESKVQLVVIENDQLALVDVNLSQYASSVKPCKDSTNKQILFSDQIWYLPRFNYYAFDISDSMFFMLRHIVHEKVNHMMRWEFYDLPIDAQRQARKIAEHFPEMDKQEIGGLMNGFQNSIFYEEPYAPLFVSKDTIIIFDHYSDHLYRYSGNLETVDSIEISYHKPKKRKTWKKQIYLDSKSDIFYGLYLQNGYSYLKQIDTKNGGVVSSTKLQNQFVKKIRVHNDYAYYIYKPHSSPTKPFIYRELLSISQ